MADGIKVENVQYKISLSRVGAQGTKGDSITNVVINELNEMVITISDAGGNVVQTINTGDIFTNGVEIEEINGINLTDPTSGEVLTYDFANSEFINQTLAEADIQAASNTEADARAAISVVAGKLTYDSGTGIIGLDPDAVTLAIALAAGANSGANDLTMQAGQQLLTNTINETTLNTGVTIDNTLIKDGEVYLKNNNNLFGYETGNTVTRNLIYMNSSNNIVIGEGANDISLLGNGFVTISANGGEVVVNDNMKIDVIDENTLNLGVTIDSVLLKDGGINLLTGVTVNAILDEDTLISNSATALATQQSIKAYVDSQIAGNNELFEILANGNTTGANNIIVTAGQQITTDTINETTAAAGVTIDGNLLKDGGITLGTGGAFNTLLDDDTFATASTTSIATTESIKAYVDTVAAAQNEWSEILANGNISNGNNVIVSAGDILTADTINETTAAAGVTIDGNLLKDGGITLGTGGAFNTLLDDDTFATASTSSIATTESIKAYVDTVAAAQNEWSEILGNGNTSGGNNVIVSVGDQLTVDTINETTAAAGVTIDGVLLKDGGIEVNGSAEFNTGAGGLAAFYHSSGAGGINIAGPSDFSSAFLILGNGVTTTPKDIYTINVEGSTDSLQIRSGGTSGTLRADFRSDGDFRLYDAAGSAVRASWEATTEALLIDTINEITAAAGVTIEAVKLIDGTIEIGSTGVTTATEKISVSGPVGIESDSANGALSLKQLATDSKMLRLINTGGVERWHNYIKSDGNDSYAQRLGFASAKFIWENSSGAQIMSLDSSGNVILADGASLDVDTINEATAAAGVTIDGVLLKDGGLTATADLNIADATHIYFSGSSGDYGRMGFTDGDPDVFVWEYFQNSGSRNYVEFTSTSEAAGDSLFNIGIGGSDVISITNASETSITNNLYVGPSATGAQLAVKTNASETTLLVDQDANGRSLEVDSESTTADVIYIVAGPTTTGRVINANANGLTTGKLMELYSNSADTSSRPLVFLHNDNTLATGTTVLSVRNDSTGNALDVTGASNFSGNFGIAGTLSVTQNAVSRGVNIYQNTDSTALYIDTAATGNAGILFPSPAQTTGRVVDISGASSLTSGRALAIQSNSADTNSRNLVEIVNDNASATGATPLRIQQDAAADGIYIEHNADASPASAVRVDLNANTAAFLADDAGTTTRNVLNINTANALTSGSTALFSSNSADTSSRNLVEIVNDNTLATGAVGLVVRQDSSDYAAHFITSGGGKAVLVDQRSNADGLSITKGQTGFGNVFTVSNGGQGAAAFLDQNGNGTALLIDSESTSASVFNVTSPATTTGYVFVTGGADALTAGAIQRLRSNGADTNSRNLVEIINDNTLATGATVLNVSQDAAQRALFVQMNGGDNAIEIDNNGYDSRALYIDSQSTTVSTVWIDTPVNTSGNVLLIENANSLTTGAALKLTSNSGDTSTRNLVEIVNDNGAAGNNTPLYVRNDAGSGYGIEVVVAATSTALNIDHNGNGHAISVQDAQATTANIARIESADALTTGGNLRIQSNSADTNSRNLVKIVNDNTLATGTTALSVTQDANAVALQVTANGATNNALVVAGSNLTTGRLASFYSNSSSTGTKNLVQITNDHTSATGTTALAILQDAAQRAVFVDQNANSNALQIDGANTTAHTIQMTTHAVTTAKVMNINLVDSLTTGGIFYLASNSADTGTRSLLNLINDNTLATGSTVATFRQDAAKQAVFVDQNANSAGIVIDTEATSGGEGLYIGAPTQTGADVILVSSANSLTTGSIFTATSNSGDTSTRNLVEIVNDNALATGAVGVYVRQDSQDHALHVDHDNSLGVAAYFESITTTGNVVRVVGDSVTTGSVLYRRGSALTTGYVDYVYSNSADTTGRNLLYVRQDNPLATSATAAIFIQDANRQAIDISKTSSGGGNAVNITNTGTGSGLFVDQNGDGTALSIDSEATSAAGLRFDAAAQTTGDIIQVNGGNSLTTGSVGYLYSNSADTSARSILEVINDNAAATNSAVARFQQDAPYECLHLVQNSTGAGCSFVRYSATAAANTTNPISTLTTTGTIQGHIQIEINGVKRWIPFYGDPS